MGINIPNPPVVPAPPGSLPPILGLQKDFHKKVSWRQPAATLFSTTLAPIPETQPNPWILGARIAPPTAPPQQIPPVFTTPQTSNFHDTPEEDDIDYAFPLTSPITSTDTPLPTVNNSFTKRDREAYLKTLPKKVQDHLNNYNGKSLPIRSFYSPPAGRHMLILVKRFGYLDDLDVLAENPPGTTWQYLAQDVPLIAKLLDLIAEYGDVDFNPLRGYPPDWEAETDLNIARTRMTSAALLYFEGDWERCVRWIGGPHVAEHRDVDRIVRFCRGKISDSALQELEMVFRRGAPQHINATSSDENFKAYYNYGNHKSADIEPDKAFKAMVKTNKRGLSLIFDDRLLLFTLHTHLTPIGCVDLNHPVKKPRVTYDASFRPDLSCHAINDWVSKDTEPILTFMDAEMVQMKHCLAVRHAHPHEEILAHADDATGAHNTIKIAPHLVGMHCSRQRGYGVAYTGSPFGVATAAPNYEPIPRARAELAQWLYENEPRIIEWAAKYIPKMSHSPPPTAAEVAQFTPAPTPDRLNPPLHDPVTNTRRAPPFKMYCDDLFVTEVHSRIDRTIAASAVSLYCIMGFPRPETFNALSLEKLNLVTSYECANLGRLWNTRDLTIGMLDYKKQQLIDTLKEFSTSASVSLSDMARLLGVVEYHTTHVAWAKPWFFALQNQFCRDLTKKYHSTARWRKKHAPTTQEHYQRTLPEHLWYRIKPMISREQARMIWTMRDPIKIDAAARTTIQQLLYYLTTDTRPWTQYIPLIVPRIPMSNSWGDASTTKGGGAFCPELEFWFDLPWPQAIIRATKLPASAEGHIGIAGLEFIVVILQLIAVRVRLDTLSGEKRDRLLPQGPQRFHAHSTNTDSSNSKSWANKVTSTSSQPQNLIKIYAELSRRFEINDRTEHIAGKINDQADDISRNDLFHLPLSIRAEQLFQKYPSMRTYDYFHPSQEILQVLYSALASRLTVGPPEIPRNLGRFEPISSTS